MYLFIQNLLKNFIIKRKKLLKKKIFYIFFSFGHDSKCLLEFFYYFNSINKLCIICPVFINYRLMLSSSLWQKQIMNLCFFLKIIYFIVQIDFLKIKNLNENFYRFIRFSILKLFKKKCYISFGHIFTDNIETLIFRIFCFLDSTKLYINYIFYSFSFYFSRFLLFFSYFIFFNNCKFFNLYWLEDNTNNKLYYSRNFLRIKILYIFFLKIKKYFFFIFFYYFKYFTMYIFNRFFLVYKKKFFKNDSNKLKNFFLISKSLVKKNIISKLYFKFFYINLLFLNFIKFSFLKINFFYSIYNLSNFNLFISFFFFNKLVFYIFTYFKIPKNEQIFYPLIFIKNKLIAICGLWYSKKYFNYCFFPILNFFFI